MDNDVLRTVVGAWAIRALPARLDAAATAKLLGFAEHDIQILLRVGKLKPLGDPAPNAPKWFSAVELIRLAVDRDWLNRASREVSRYWRHKRERCAKPRLGGASAEKETVCESENLSPKISLDLETASAGEKSVEELERLQDTQ